MMKIVIFIVIVLHGSHLVVCFYYIPRWYTHPKTVTHPSTNSVRCVLTSFVQWTPLTSMPCRERLHSHVDICAVQILLLTFLHAAVHWRHSLPCSCVFQSGWWFIRNTWKCQRIKNIGGLEKQTALDLPSLLTLTMWLSSCGHSTFVMRRVYCIALLNKGPRMSASTEGPVHCWMYWWAFDMVFIAVVDTQSAHLSAWIFVGNVSVWSRTGHSCCCRSCDYFIGLLNSA